MFLIRVTEDDVQRGHICDTGRCPLALACGRYFNLVCFVDLNEAWVSTGQGWEIYIHDAVEKIIRFDSYGVFEVGMVEFKFDRTEPYKTGYESFVDARLSVRSPEPQASCSRLRWGIHN